MASRNDLERRILRLLAEPTTESALLGGIPYPEDPGGGYDDEEIRAAIRDLLFRGSVLLVRTPRAKTRNR
jgi:hypothetical protein